MTRRSNPTRTLGLSLALSLGLAACVADNTQTTSTAAPAGNPDTVATSAIDNPVIDCSDAPEGAVLALPEPGNNIAAVVCTAAGHVLAPAPNVMWMFPGGRPVIVPPAEYLPSKVVGHNLYFTDIEVGGTDATEQKSLLTRLAQIFPNDKSIPKKAFKVVAKTSMGATRTVIFYSYFRADGPSVWGMVCDGNCEGQLNNPFNGLPFFVNKVTRGDGSDN